MRSKLPIALLGFVLLPLRAASQNVIPNPEFETDASGWSYYSPGTGTGWSESEGDPETGAMALVSPGACGCATSAHICAPVLPSTVYHISYHVKKASAGTSPTLLGYLQWFASPNCIDQISGNISFDFTSFAALPTAVWQTRLRGTLVSWATAHSVWIELGFDDPSAALPTLFIDSVAFAGPIVFVDGFESGLTDLWSVP